MEKLSLEILHHIGSYLDIDEYIDLGRANKKLFDALPWSEYWDLHHSLRAAIVHNYVGTIVQILERMKIKSTTPHKSSLDDAMYLVCRNGNVSYISWLLESFYVDNDSWVFMIARSNSVESVRFLLGHKVLDEKLFEDVLFKAAQSSPGIDIEVVKLFLSDGRYRSIQYKDKLLKPVCEHDRLEIFNLILETCQIISAETFRFCLQTCKNEFAIALVSHMLPSLPSDNNLQKILDEVWKYGDVECAKLLLSNPNYKPNLIECFQIAIQRQQDQLIMLLLDGDRVDPLKYNKKLFQVALNQSNNQLLKRLLRHPRLNPTFDNQYVIRYASHVGQADIEEMLLKDPRIDPSANDNECICIARIAKVVKLLLDHPLVDPRARNDKPLITACQYGHNEKVEFLLKDERLMSSLTMSELSTLVHKLIRAAIDSHKNTILSTILSCIESDRIRFYEYALKLVCDQGKTDKRDQLLKDYETLIGVQQADIPESCLPTILSKGYKLLLSYMLPRMEFTEEHLLYACKHSTLECFEMVLKKVQVTLELYREVCALDRLQFITAVENAKGFKSEWNITRLMNAFKISTSSAIKQLDQADPNIALVTCCKLGEQNIAEFLLDRGVTPSDEACRMAYTSGHNGVLDLLLSRGGNVDSITPDLVGKKSGPNLDRILEKYKSANGTRR